MFQNPEETTQTIPPKSPEKVRSPFLRRCPWKGSQNRLCWSKLTACPISRDARHVPDTCMGVFLNICVCARAWGFRRNKSRHASQTCNTATPPECHIMPPSPPQTWSHRLSSPPSLTGSLPIDFVPICHQHDSPPPPPVAVLWHPAVLPKRPHNTSSQAPAQRKGVPAGTPLRLTLACPAVPSIFSCPKLVQNPKGSKSKGSCTRGPTYPHHCVR